MNRLDQLCLDPTFIPGFITLCFIALHRCCVVGGGFIGEEFVGLFVLPVEGKALILEYCDKARGNLSAGGEPCLPFVKDTNLRSAVK